MKDDLHADIAAATVGDDRSTGEKRRHRLVLDVQVDRSIPLARLRSLLEDAINRNVHKLGDDPLTPFRPEAKLIRAQVRLLGTIVRAEIRRRNMAK